MTKFSNIEGNASQKEEVKVKTEEPKVIQPSSDGMDTSAFVNFVASPREMPKVDIDVDDNDRTTTSNDDFSTETEPDQERLKRDESWFKRVFGGKDDSPVSEEQAAELDDEMYAASGQIGSEITDAVLPQLINSMHGTEDVSEYQATETQKEGLAKAWELYLRSIQRKVTPLTYLIGKIAVVYGGKFISGLFVYLSRLREIGFHWPWSNGWKKKYRYVSLSNATDDEVGRVVEEPIMEQQPPAPQPAPAPRPQGPQQPVQPRQEPKLEKVTGNMKECLYDKTQFEEGKGFPRTSKSTPELIDSFATYSNYVTYCNKNGLRNKKKNKD